MSADLCRQIIHFTHLDEHFDKESGTDVQADEGKHNLVFEQHLKNNAGLFILVLNISDQMTFFSIPSKDKVSTQSIKIPIAILQSFSLWNKHRKLNGIQKCFLSFLFCILCLLWLLISRHTLLAKITMGI